LVAAGCGSGTPIFRIGLLLDCYGPQNSLEQLLVASAELPLLERGAKLLGRGPLDGVGPVVVGGRRIQLLAPACVAGNEDVIPEARRLVEEDGARALVGPVDPQQGMVLLQYARRRPASVFLIQPSDAAEVTLGRSAPNVFRFAPDAAQAVAGLASYAYRKLGWRTALAIGDDIPYGWETVAGFVAEFCALGGHVERRWLQPGTDTAPFARVSRGVDGVFFGALLSSAAGLLERDAHAGLDVATHVVGGRSLLVYPQAVALANGVVVAGTLPLVPTAEKQAYAAAFKRAFRGFRGQDSLDPTLIAYRDGVEALLEALAGGRGGLDARLGRLSLASPTGTLVLDRHRQAVVVSYLDRITGKTPQPVATVRGVDASFGGVFPTGASPPSRDAPPCIRHPPPRWSSLSFATTR
jgi:branched-chain amino acid transport system substrate-binding protein